MNFSRQPDATWWSLGWAALVLLLVYGMVVYATRRPNPYRDTDRRAHLYTLNPLLWAEGADGYVSTSKLQLLLWSGVAFFSFVAIYVERLGQGPLNPFPNIPNVPGNLLIAIGFTGGTLTVAKGIVVSKLQSGTLTKVSADTPGARDSNPFADLFVGDDGSIDLGKVQMMAWTGIALAIYIGRLIVTLAGNTGGGAGIPDIDPTLMALTGLSQGTYLGKKLVTVSTPRMTALDPMSAPAGQTVTVYGAGFGPAQSDGVTSANGGLLQLNGATVPARAWSDTQIAFVVPANDPSTRKPWASAVARAQPAATISVVVNGQQALAPNDQPGLLLTIG